MENLNPLVKHFIIPGLLNETLVFKNIDTYDDILNNKKIIMNSYTSLMSIARVNELMSKVDSKIKTTTLFKDFIEKYKSILNKLILNDSSLPISIYTIIKLIRELKLDKIEVNSEFFKLFRNDAVFIEIKFSKQTLPTPSLISPLINSISLVSLHYKPNRIYELTKINDNYRVITYREENPDIVNTFDVELRMSEHDINAERVVNALNTHLTTEGDTDEAELSIINTIIPNMIIPRLEDKWIVKITLSFIYQLLDSGYSIIFYPDERIVFNLNGKTEVFNSEASSILNIRYLIG